MLAILTSPLDPPLSWVALHTWLSHEEIVAEAPEIDSPEGLVRFPAHGEAGAGGRVCLVSSFGAVLSARWRRRTMVPSGHCYKSGHVLPLPSDSFLSLLPTRCRAILPRVCIHLRDPTTAPFARMFRGTLCLVPYAEMRLLHTRLATNESTACLLGLRVSTALCCPCM